MCWVFSMDFFFGYGRHSAVPRSWHPVHERRVPDCFPSSPCGGRVTAEVWQLQVFASAFVKQLI
jgi:hypothetical protein